MTRECLKRCVVEQALTSSHRSNSCCFRYQSIATTCRSRKHHRRASHECLNSQSLSKTTKFHNHREWLKKRGGEYLKLVDSKVVDGNEFIDIDHLYSEISNETTKPLHSLPPKLYAPPRRFWWRIDWELGFAVVHITSFVGDIVVLVSSFVILCCLRCTSQRTEIATVSYIDLKKIEIVLSSDRTINIFD